MATSWLSYWNKELNLKYKVLCNRYNSVKSTRFHSKDLYITFISVLDLMNEKNTAFSGRPWNLADFIMKSGGFHAKDLYITFISVLDLMNEKNTAFSGRPWNLVNFMKSGGFHHEIRWISSMKSAWFHGWSWNMQTWKCKIFITLIPLILHKPDKLFL